MGKVFVSDTHLTNIANAVREKNGKTTKYKPSEIPNAIKAIEVTEDLSSELTTQNNLLTNQTSKLSSVVTALQGKASGGSSKVLTGGDISISRIEGNTALGGYLKIGNDFDGTKKYKLKLFQSVSYGAVEGAVPIVFDLDLTYVEENGSYYCELTTGFLGESEYTLNPLLSSVMGDYCQYVTNAGVYIVPSYGMLSFSINTSDTSTVPNLTMGVWLESV